MDVHLAPPEQCGSVTGKPRQPVGEDEEADQHQEDTGGDLEDADEAFESVEQGQKLVQSERRQQEGKTEPEGIEQEQNDPGQYYLPWRQPSGWMPESVRCRGSSLPQTRVRPESSRHIRPVYGARRPAFHPVEVQWAPVR